MEENASLDPLPSGTRLHEFILGEPLGRGGIGIVYAAEHALLKETFAIKEFLPMDLACRTDGGRVAPRRGQEALYDKLREKFMQEGRTLVQLAHPRPHPNLAQVTDAFEENDTVYLCMRFERGESLESILKKRGRIGEIELKSWLFPLLDGLEHAHARQVWHRDIKPANILIDASGTPILVDFGAACRERPAGAVSLVWQYTPEFASPEQLLGGPQGPWTDIYSMAATCFHAIAGGMASPQSPDWRTQCQGYGETFLAALEAGLRLDPRQRPQSIAQWKKLFDAPGEQATDAAISSGGRAIGHLEIAPVFAAASAPPISGNITQVLDAAAFAPAISPPAPETAERSAASDGTPPAARSKFGRWIYPLAGAAVLLASLPLLLLLLNDRFAAPEARDPAFLSDWTTASGPPGSQARDSAASMPTPAAGPALPDVARLSERLELPRLACADVALTAAPDRGIRLSGYLRDRAQLTGLLERLQTLAPGTGIEDRDVAFAMPFCDILAAMQARGALAAAYPGMPEVRFNHADRQYREDDYLVLEILNPGPVGGHLQLDFIDSDQQVVHLFPNAVMPDRLIVPGARLEVGAHDARQCRERPDACFMIARPHGNNLIMATWSETPLLDMLRRPQSEAARTYLAALTAAIGGGDSEPGIRHAVAYRFFTTTP